MKEHYLLRWLDASHLPYHLADVVKPFHALGVLLDMQLEDGSEKTTSLRKLIESKDCAVRAVLDGLPNRGLK